MNRHERRAASARMPEGYRLAIHRLDGLLREVVTRIGVPRFALPPADHFVIGSLDEVGHAIARNAAAHELVERACKCELREMPTIAMLRAALDVHRIAVEPITYAEIEAATGVKAVVMGRGGDG